MRAGTHRDLHILVLKKLFWMQKNNRWGLVPVEAINSGHNVAVVYAQNHRWGLGPIETSNSDAKVAVLNAQNHRWKLGPIDNCPSGSKLAVLHSQINRRCLGPIETCNSCPRIDVLHANTKNEGWDLYRLVILMLKSLIWMHKTTDEGWDQ